MKKDGFRLSIVDPSAVRWHSRMCLFIISGGSRKRALEREHHFMKMKFISEDDNIVIKLQNRIARIEVLMSRKPGATSIDYKSM